MFCAALGAAVGGGAEVVVAVWAAVEVEFSRVPATIPREVWEDGGEQDDVPELEGQAGVAIERVRISALETR